MLLTSRFQGTDLCIADSLTSPQGEPKWTKVFARGEEFSVLLPEAPSMAAKSRPDKEISARYQGRIYGAYGEGVVYIIISENNPNHAEKLETFVGEFRKTLPRHRSKGKSELRFDREINLNNFPGQRFRVRFYNGLEGIVDFYLTKKHVYVVEVVGGDESNPQIKQFFNAFSLDKDILGKEEEARLMTSATVTSEPVPTPGQGAGEIFSPKEVTRPAFAVSRPEPFYTAGARQNQIVGTVALRAVLSSSGKVTNIEVVSGLKHGLTERAVEAAKRLRFIPAVKDGNFVSQSTEIEYNFNLY